ncbi:MULTISPECIES: hypothetical protein [Eubacterium]|uniref:hypothetical protein n=1 Tax=Eubacterium TaxID=1730 RepID=UPI001FA9108F|nr:hypothetical protein [Eubacterium sp. AF36-5BH]
MTKILKPNISNHNIPLIYFSDKRENVLVYLSNAIEKFCKEKHFKFEGFWHKWGPYGFDKDGKLCLEEYYPNALKETYSGVEGYIYSCDNISTYKELNIHIPNAYISDRPTKVEHCEYVSDAYYEVIKAEQEGLITICRYDEFIKKRKEWLQKTIRDEFANSLLAPDYRFFLENKFADILAGK